MNDINSIKDYDGTAGKDNFPRIQLVLKTWWYRKLIGSGAFAILWIVMIVIFEIGRTHNGTEITDICLFWTHFIFGILVLSTLITGSLQRTTLIVVKIDKQLNLLIYMKYWSNIRVKHKRFKIEDIDRFDVLKRLRSGGRFRTIEWESLALRFHTKNPMYITDPKEQSNTIKYAKILNDFLASNTNINTDRLREAFTPNFSKRAMKLMVVYFLSMCAIIIIAIVVVVMVLVGA